MIHMRKKRLAVGFLAAAMLFGATAAASSGTVTASGLILREKASSSSEALTTIRQGKTVEILEQSGSWYKVSYGKYTGYVYGSYLTINGLKQGDKGDEVKAVQQRLKELGYYSSTCDGNYGSVTAKAVKAFQAKNDLTADGIADDATIKAMNASTAIDAKGKTASATATVTTAASSTSLQKGDKGDAVKALQQRLKELGYYKYTCDSSYGDRTVEAVKAFQKNNGLTQDGIAGSATQKKLNSTSAIKADGTKANATATPKATATPAASSDTLQKGDKGTAVKVLQQRLKELGYYTYTCDSSYGDRTVEAVKAFQKNNGLTQDGIAGSATQKKLNSTSAIKADGTKANATATPKATAPPTPTASSDTLQKGDKGTAVKALQQRLKELGYYKYTCDSSYGDRTVEAVKAFQKNNGLTQDGIAGSATQKKLNSTSAIKADGTKANATATPTATASSTLQKGDSGYAVKVLQQRLKELGYYTTSIDGDYGARTVEAVKAFQKKNGLTQDGIAGPTTQAKLNSSSAIGAKDNESKDDVKEDGVLQKGDKGEQVTALQKRLKELGYYTLTPDGEYGSRTVTAVKEFQKKNGLTQDGIAGSTTQAKLNSSSAIAANATTSVTLNTNQTLKKGDKGDQVKALQQRLKELGYYNTTVDSSYGYQTTTSVSEFQRLNGLNVTGTADSTTLKKLVASDTLTKSEALKAEQEKEPTYVTEQLDWFKEGYKTFPSKAIIKVKDVKTGLVFNAKVMYGSNHLDAEPLTAADTAILLKINGGTEFSWHRRPMLVQYNGHVYAASIYSEPHGDQTIKDNNFDGQFCLHFYGSKTHGTNVVDADHQSCVAQAMKATW